MAVEQEIQKRLKPYEKEIEYCSYCPKLCRFACPVANFTCSEASTPTGKMTILKLVKDGVLELDQDSAQLLYQCSGCILSRTYCEHQIEVIGAFEAGRSLAVERGLAPARVMEFAGRWQKQGNPYGKDLASTLKQISNGRHLENKKVLFFSGCTMTNYFPETIKEILKVLERISPEFQIFAEEKICCGYPLYTTGHWKVFKEHQSWLAERLGGYDLIISPCPTCVWFLKSQYQESGLIEVGAIKHITELVSENFTQLSLKGKIKERVLYHDPCHLGRYLGVYQAPRQILQEITEEGYLEFYENQEQANCCGGGGGLGLSHPEIARGIARARIQEAVELGAEILASACPMCERMLSRPGKEAGIKVKDLCELVAELI